MLNRRYLRVLLGAFCAWLAVAVPIGQLDASRGHKGHQGVLYYKGDGKTKRIALTFDDGPDDYFTPKVLDILKQERVHATFFVVGRMVQKYPWVLKRIVREGHVVGNHSWDHPYFTRISNNQILRQVAQTDAIIRRVTGKEPKLVRPPYGYMDKRVMQVLQQNGYVIVQWSLDTQDWQGPSSEEVMQKLTTDASPGDIVLQHTGGSKRLSGSVQALPKMIRMLRSRGYELVTLDRLLKLSPYNN